MQIEKNEYRFSSTTGVGELYARSWTPADAGEVRAIFQIAHGMAEHGARYDEFAQYLCTRGFAVYVIDHAGHGKSAAHRADYGYFGERDGWLGIVNDCKLLTDIARREYPEKPVLFFGHSMGSFVARLYAEKYGSELAGAIFCGTSGPNPAAGLGIFITNLLAKSKGGRHRSEFVHKLALGANNKRIPNPRTASDWLTRDTAIVDAYEADPECGFNFTVAGFRDMFRLLQAVSAKSWYENLRRDLPILLISGKEDPVGGYGAGVELVERELRESGHDKLQCTLYDDCRHEILNELNRSEIFGDIADWASKQLS